MTSRYDVHFLSISALLELDRNAHALRGGFDGDSHQDLELPHSFTFINPVCGAGQLKRRENAEDTTEVNGRTFPISTIRRVVKPFRQFHLSRRRRCVGTRRTSFS